MTQMNGRSNGPKAPKVERLEELIDYLTSVKQDGREGDQDVSVEIRTKFNNTIQEVIEALDWTHTMLSNRAGYQKKQQTKRKILEQWAKENLSADELLELDRQAEVKANG